MDMEAGGVQELRCSPSGVLGAGSAVHLRFMRPQRGQDSRSWGEGAGGRIRPESLAWSHPQWIGS